MTALFILECVLSVAWLTSTLQIMSRLENCCSIDRQLTGLMGLTVAITISLGQNG
jgi:hypothetical protein